MLSWSAVLAGVAVVEEKKICKDALYDELGGGVFFPLVVESLGLWSTASYIAVRITTMCGNSCGFALRHLLEQLSVCLRRHNAQTFLHLFTLLPGSPLQELELFLL